MKSGFLKTTAIVVTGTAGAQMITMAFSPIITRLYGPEAFGLYGSFMAMLTLLIPIAALTYPIAIVLPEKKAEAKKVFIVSILLAFSFSSLLFMLLLIYGDSVFSFLGMRAISSYALLLPLGMFFSAIQQALQYWFLRNNKFKVTAFAAIAQSLVVNSTKSGIGVIYPFGSVLIIVNSVGYALYAAFLCIGDFWHEKVINSKNEKNGDQLCDLTLVSVALKYSSFPKYRAPQALANAFSQSMPVMFIAGFFGPAYAGFYTLTRSVLVLPINVISKAVGDSLYPKAAELYRNHGDVYSLFLKATFLLFGIGLIPFSVIVVYGPTLFKFIFGSEWSLAGAYAQWLAIWMYFAFINKPSIIMISVMGWNRFFFIYEFVGLVIRVLCLVFGYYLFDSDLMSVALFSMAGVLLNISLIIYVGIYSKRLKY
jgi:O-antigen/teichoic acid export membrane protein